MTEQEIQALIEERDTLKGERDQIAAERDTLKGERDQIAAERDEIKAKYKEKFGTGNPPAPDDKLESEVIDHFKKIF